MDTVWDSWLKCYNSKSQIFLVSSDTCRKETKDPVITSQTQQEARIQPDLLIPVLLHPDLWRPKDSMYCIQWTCPCWCYKVTHTHSLQRLGMILALLSTIDTFHKMRQVSATFSCLYGLVVWQVKPARASWDLASTSWVLAEAPGRRLGLQRCCYHLKEIYDSERVQQNVFTQMIPFPTPSPGAAAAGGVRYWGTGTPHMETFTLDRQLCYTE